METFATSGGVRNWIFVRVSTDEGLWGWGEASTEFWDATIVAAVRELGGRLLGLDAAASETAWQRLYRHGFWRGGVVLQSALSALDQALWDIRGKALGVPVHRLLGGPTRDRVRLYTHVGIYRPEFLVEDAKTALAAGYRTLKTGAWAGDSGLEPRQRLHRFVERFEELRDAVGEDVDLLVDNHGRSGPAEAVRLVHALAGAQPGWLEEPIPPESPELVGPVTEAAHRHGIPVALGERAFSRWDLRHLLERQLVDIVQPDLCHVGGLTEAVKVSSFADVYRCSVAPHNPGGPVSTAAAAHLALAIPNFEILEYCADEPRRSQVLATPWPVADGYLRVPDRPGLGVEIDLDAVRAVPPSAAVVPASAFGPDGAVADV